MWALCVWTRPGQAGWLRGFTPARSHPLQHGALLAGSRVREGAGGALREGETRERRTHGLLASRTGGEGAGLGRRKLIPSFLHQEGCRHLQLGHPVACRLPPIKARTQRHTSTCVPNAPTAPGAHRQPFGSALTHGLSWISEAKRPSFSRDVCCREWAAKSVPNQLPSTNSHGFVPQLPSQQPCRHSQGCRTVLGSPRGVKKAAAKPSPPATEPGAFIPLHTVTSALLEHPCLGAVGRRCKGRERGGCKEPVGSWAQTLRAALWAAGGAERLARSRGGEAQILAPPLLLRLRARVGAGCASGAWILGGGAGLGQEAGGTRGRPGPGGRCCRRVGKG